MDAQAVPRPILLFGMPRSGTTWLGKILDSHPDTYYLHEPDSRVSIKIPLLVTTSDLSEYKKTVEVYITSLKEIRRADVLSKLPIFRKNYYTKVHYLLRYVNVLLAKGVAQKIRNFPIFPFLGSACYVRFVWKSIESAGRLGLMLRAVPICQAVYLVRHPCGYVASIIRGEKRGKFVSHTKSSEDYGVLEMLLRTEYAQENQLTIGKLKRMSPIQRLAWRWVLFNEKVLIDTAGLCNMRVILYEDLCANPCKEVKKIFRFLDLPWSTQSEHFVLNSTSNEKSGYYSVYKDPTKVAKMWERSLAESEIQDIVEIVSYSRSGQLFNL